MNKKPHFDLKTFIVLVVKKTFSLVQWKNLDIVQRLLAEKPRLLFANHFCFRLKSIPSRETHYPSFCAPRPYQVHRNFSAFTLAPSAWGNSACNGPSEGLGFAQEEPTSKATPVTDALYFEFGRPPVHAISRNERVTVTMSWITQRWAKSSSNQGFL